MKSIVPKDPVTIVQRIVVILVIVMVLVAGSMALGVYGFFRVSKNQATFVAEKQATADLAVQSTQWKEQLYKDNPKLRVPKPPPIPEHLQGGRPVPEHDLVRPTPVPVPKAKPVPHSRRHKARPSATPGFWQRVFTPRR